MCPISFSSLISDQLVWVVNTCNPIWEMEAEGSGPEDHPQLCNEFYASLDYVCPSDSVPVSFPPSSLLLRKINSSHWAACA